SGPARPARLRQPAAGALAAERGLALGLLERLANLSDHRLIDRLIRGRAWIALVVFALLGIVTLQLTLLKLNAGIGRSLERAALLQREDAALSIENSELTSGGRVETAAERLGMSLVPAGSLKFLTAHRGSDPAHAAAALSAPVKAGAVSEAPSSGESEGAAAASSETSSPAESGGGGGEGTSSATAGASEGEASSSATRSEASSESAPASSESTPPSSSSSPSSEATSPSAGESGPGGGTQAGPTG
ncbi:MAG: hypothetical protein H0X28_15480, partial [Solirubrobacterales bacterium]|nr:hypothetical protein [Solirubrobacterales bacterium]